jgi:hypothetical protein
LNPEGLQRQVKGGSAGNNRDGMGRSHIGCKLPFKLEGPLPHGEPAGTDYVSSRLCFLFPNRSHMEWHCHYARFLTHTIHSLDVFVGDVALERLHYQGKS